MTGREEKSHLFQTFPSCVVIEKPTVKQPINSPNPHSTSGYTHDRLMSGICTSNYN